MFSLNRRTALFGAAAVGASAGIAACSGSGGSGSGGSGDSGSSRTIRVGHYFAEDHPNHLALNDVFKAKVEEESGGDLQVQIFPNSQLGDEEQMGNAVRGGTLDMALLGMLLGNARPKISALEFPFLFRDYDHAQNVLSSDIGTEFEDEFRDLGLEPLGWQINGMRVISSNRPILSMDDFAGFRVRTPNLPVYIKTLEGLGASVNPMAITEIFTALEQGVIDGQENPYTTVLVNGWHEVQSHILESNHLFSPNCFLAGEFLEELDDDAAEIVRNAAAEACESAWTAAQESEGEVKAELAEEHGVTITVPDESFKEEMVATSDAVYEDLYAEFEWAEDIVNRIRAVD